MYILNNDDEFLTKEEFEIKEERKRLLKQYMDEKGIVYFKTPEELELDKKLERFNLKEKKTYNIDDYLDI